MEDAAASTPDRGSERLPDSRERLLAAACDLAVEHFESAAGLRDAFSYLTPGAVADRAGLSRGLIYHHWGSPEDGPQAFERFLDAVAERLWVDAAVPGDLAELAGLLPDDLDEVVVALTAAELARYTGRDRARLRASQALTLHGASPEGASQALVSSIANLIRVLGEKVGVEPVPPLTYEDVAFSVLALFEGFGLFQNVLLDHALRMVPWDPAAAARPSPGDDAPAAESASPREWTVLAIAARGVVTAMTRPVAERAGRRPRTSD